MATLWQNMRLGLRTLRKKPGFAAVTVLTLALGIGANTVIFSVINAVAFRPLPYTDPDRLVMVWNNFHGLGMTQVVVSALEFGDYKQRNKVFEQIAAYGQQSFGLRVGKEPEQVWGASVSANLFSLLGVTPQLGRTFLAEEEQSGRDQGVIISHDLWQRRFNSDPQVVGKTLWLDGKTVTVVGVMPTTVRFPSTDIQVWRPLAFQAEELSERQRGSRGLRVIGRLRPGATLNDAQTDMQTVARQLVEEHPQQYTSNMGFAVTVLPLYEYVVGDVREALLVLWGAVGFVLLIGCANVANLLLARAATRQKEIAIRTALGASRGRVVGQLLTESMLLALVGGVAGSLLALWGVDAVVSLVPAGTLPRLDELSVDARVLGFTLVVSLMTGLLFGLAPALRASRTELTEALKEGSRGATESLRRNRLRSLLVVTEIAMALVLLIGAGLLIRGFARLVSIPTGFNPDDALTMRIALPMSKYQERQQQADFFRRLIERVGALPGVEATGVVTSLPLSGWRNDWSISLEGIRGMEGLPTDTLPQANYFAVNSDYFRAMGIPLLGGRTFSDEDNDGPPVVVINQTLARRFWPNENPIGKRLKTGGQQSPYPWRTIVGVVGDVRQTGLETDVMPEIFVPYRDVRKALMNAMFLVVRAGARPTSLVAAVRAAVAELDPDQAVSSIRTLEERVALSVAERRFNMLLLGVFAALALVLAGVGIYSVMAYSVTERTHEIGVRMALGAQASDVLKLVVRQGMVLALIGVTIGLGAALALTRLMSSLLFEVSATDPATFVLMALLLAVVALLACWVPARRATRVDPMVALRYE
jgi:putative ABC transport system permease protein